MNIGHVAVAVVGVDEHPLVKPSLVLACTEQPAYEPPLHDAITDTQFLSCNMGVLSASTGI